MANITNRMKDTWAAISRSDGWENAITALGTALASLSHHTIVGEAWLSTAVLDAVYEQDPIGRRIVTEPVSAAFRQGFDLAPPQDMDEDQAQAGESQIREHLSGIDAIELLKKSFNWGRLYGRGGLMLGARDGASDPIEPLDYDSVREFPWVRELTSDEFAAHELDEDPDSPQYGLPESWTVTLSTGGASADVHRSRILLTGAIPTTRAKRAENEWRDIPVLQAVYDDLRNFDSAKTGMAQMLVDASQAVLKIQNLPGILADDPTLLKARLRILEMSRALHVMPIDAGSNVTAPEDFQFVERSFAGVADVFDRLLGALASGVGWPQTYLFGRSPAGENATGESDQDIWDDLVKADQDVYSSYLQILVNLTASALGLTEGWTVTFRPLRQEDPTEQAKNQKTIAETDVANVNAGILDELTIARHRYGGDVYDPSPVRLAPEDIEAMKKIQELDRARALNPPEPPAMVPDQFELAPEEGDPNAEEE